MRLKLITLLTLLMTAGAVMAASLSGLPFEGNFRMSSDFGLRERPCNGCSTHHPAVDYATPIGTPMISTVNGTVSRVVSTPSGYGNFVTVLSDSGNYAVQYSHLDSSNVTVGQAVTAGETIAISGNSGSGTGAHLDYKVSVLDPATGEMVPVDPVLAQGLDLDDPAVRANLVADSLVKLDGSRTAVVGDGTVTGFGAFTAIPPENTENYEGPILGCDTEVYAHSEAVVEGFTQLSDEIVKQNITKPTPIEIAACLDQMTERINQSGSLHANPGSNLSASFAPFVQQPIVQSVNNFTNSVLGLDITANPIGYAITESFNDVVNTFTSGLSSLIPGTPPPSNCGMREQIWLIEQCLQRPRLPDFVSIIDDRLASVAGDIASMVNPERYIEQVCNNISSPISGFVGDLNDELNSAADALTTPITDSINN